jgi:excisionase family DNA binding protein
MENLTQNEGSLMTVKEVSEYLNISIPTVKTYVRIGILKASNIGAGQYSRLRFNRIDIQEFLRKRNIN